jgi:glutathione S-transferase
MFLTLYQFPAARDVFSVSPFCAKLEAFLRWQAIPYHSQTISSLRGAPKGKVPYIEDENGKRGDSNLIIEYLCRKHQLDPDAILSDEQRAMARTVRYLCEESLYRVMAYMRFVDDTGWHTIRHLLMPKAPRLLRCILVPRIRAYVRKQLIQQGIARHTRDEIIAIAKDDLKSLDDMLGDKAYFFGDQMTLADLTVFSVVGNFLNMPFPHPVCDYAQSLPRLVAHTQRVKQQCFATA